jgi:hypothetical protein
VIREEDFYQQQGYWERANDNLARWLGVQQLTTYDVFILLPLIPLFALLIIWWAPWEGWFFRDLPKTISGPYLLYCAFALWHFHAPWWPVALLAIIGAALCAIALRDRWKPRRQPEP